MTNHHATAILPDHLRYENFVENPSVDKFKVTIDRLLSGESIGGFSITKTKGDLAVINDEISDQIFQKLHQADPSIFVQSHDGKTVTGCLTKDYTFEKRNQTFGFTLKDTAAYYQWGISFTRLKNWWEIKLRDVKVKLKLKFGSDLQAENPDAGVTVGLRTVYFAKMYHGSSGWHYSTVLYGGDEIYSDPDGDSGQRNGQYSQCGARVYKTRKGLDTRVEIIPYFILDTDADIDVAEYILSGNSGEEQEILNIVAEIVDEENIQSLYPTKGEMIAEWKERVRKYEIDYGINFDRELYTVGNSGRIVAWINEQCQLLGVPFSMSNTQYSQETYNGMIQLKKYFKEINPDLYDALELDNSCNENKYLTGRAECDGFGPCGCYTIGCAIFQEYSDDLSETEPTDNWRTMIHPNSLDKSTSSPLVNAFSNVPTSFMQNNVMTLEINDSVCFSVKDGWELLLKVNMLDPSGNLINIDCQPFENGNVWEAQGTDAWYRLKGGDVFGVGPGMHHRVGTKLNNPPFSLHRISKLRKGKWAMAPILPQLLSDMGYGSNQILNSRVRIEILKVRSPFNEWLGGGVTIPSKFGSVSGLAGAARAAKDLQSKFNSDFMLSAELLIGYELEVLFVFTVEAGIIFRCEANKDHLSVELGAYVQTAAEIPRVAEAMADVRVLTGYKLRWDYFSADLSLMFKALFNIFLPEDYEFKTPNLDTIRLPYTATTKTGLTVHNYSVENTIAEKRINFTSDPYLRKQTWSTQLNNTYLLNTLKLTSTSNKGDPITGEAFEEIEMFLGFQDPNGGFVNKGDMREMGLSLLNNGLAMVLFSAANTGVGELSNKLLGTSTPLALLPVGTVVSLGKSRQFLSVLSSMFNKISYVRSPDRILPSFVANGFEKKLHIGIKGKAKYPKVPNSSHSDQRINAIVNDYQNDGNSLKTNFSTMHTGGQYDIGFHVAFSGKWSWEQWPKIPIAGPFVLGGLKYSVEVGIEFDAWLSDLGLTNQENKISNFRQYVIDTWMDRPPETGGE